MENIIRSDINTELLEILELYCELLLARVGLLEAKECDPGLEEAVKSIIYAAPRTDVRELHQARQLLVEKYGKDFALVAIENKDGKVAERVLRKLRVEPPPQELVTLYLQEIARTYGIAWPKNKELPEDQRGEDNEDNEDGEDGENPSGGQSVKSLEEPLVADQLNRATPPRNLGPKSPVSVTLPSPRMDDFDSQAKLPSPPEFKPNVKKGGMRQNRDSEPSSSGKGEVGGTKGVVGGKIPDVDNLEARFAALKK